MEWNFKEGAEVYTEEFWYDLTDGGYIKPENVLADDEQIAKLKAAIDLVRSFERAIDEQKRKLTKRAADVLVRARKY